MDREAKRSLIIQVATRMYQERVEWALDAFEAGADSGNLRILASLALAKPPDPREVDDYFRRSFEELGWKMPEPEVYRRQHARDVAEKILTSEGSPIAAGVELDKIARGLTYSKGPGFWGELDYLRYMTKEGYTSEESSKMRSGVKQRRSWSLR